MRAVGKAFSTLGKSLAALPEEDSDISDSDDDELNHFIYDISSQECMGNQ
jgi:hypothetical protein